jgi:Uma2 family endonuclease
MYRRPRQETYRPGNGSSRRGQFTRHGGEDLLDKRAQYAAAGIQLYLVVVLDDKYHIWEIREFHLDAAASAYRLHAVHRTILDLEQPVRLTLPVSELVAA